MKKMMFLFVFLFSVPFVFAQVPEAFQYQAVVRDANGDIVSGQLVSFRLSIISGSPSGTVVYSETHSATTNAFGLVNLSVGTGTVVSGIFSQISWGSASHYLKVEADITGGTSYVNMGTTQLLSVPYAMFAGQAGNSSGLWDSSGVNIYNTNTGKVGIGTTTPPGKLVVQGDASMPDTVPLFEVKDRNGATVFIIYPDSARLYVGDDGSKTNKGAFAVSGRNTAKQLTNNYLWVTPDSTRIFLDSASTKGGFAVQSFGTGTNKDYMSVYVDTAQVINPSVSRVLWYPSKSAFLSGRVLIESPDSVGTNSWATGFEAKAIGNYSQAMGYRTRAFGKNSTAIGNNANARGKDSYALGNFASTLQEGSYAIGTGSSASGLMSFAFGSTGVDSNGVATSPTIATGDYSYAFGMGSIASNQGAFAFGSQDTASGYYAMALGNNTKASGGFSTTLGAWTKAEGYMSTAMGLNSTASGYLSTAMGQNTSASGPISTSMGYVTSAGGYASTAMGTLSSASADYSTAMGYNTLASGSYSTAMGRESNASGQVSLALGYLDTASGQYAIAMGVATHAAGYGSHSTGYYTLASGQNSFSMGAFTKSSGVSSLAMGNQSVAEDYCTFAGGERDTARGSCNFVYGYQSKTTNSASYSMAVGLECLVTKPGSVALGYKSNVSGSFSFAAGNEATVTSDYAFASGRNSTSSGYCATSMGYWANASGGYAPVALGYATLASGDASFAAGYGTKATGSYSVALGLGIEAHGIGSFGIGLNNTVGTVINDNYTMAIMGGEVGIGTVSPDKLLHVAGDARVEGNIYYGPTGSATFYNKPDFVFKPGYQKKYSTDQIEDFILKNNHLPWVTPASEEKEGVNMTRMAFETLEAVENIQMQVIQLRKENEALKEEIKQLKEKNTKN